MKTAVHSSSIFCGALAVFLILCSTAQLSNARAVKGRPTPHVYDEYPNMRASIKKVLDGTYAALTFLGQASTQQGYLLPRHSSVNGGLTQVREAVEAAVKAYEIGSTFRSLLSTKTGAMEIQRGLDTDVCEWISSTLLPATNFTCTADNIRSLSKVMKVYQALLELKNKVEIIAPATNWRNLTPQEYRCAWINSRVLNNCSPRPQSSLVTALDQAYTCSLIDTSGSYNLCSNL